MSYLPYRDRFDGRINDNAQAVIGNLVGHDRLTQEHPCAGGRSKSWTRLTPTPTDVPDVPDWRDIRTGAASAWRQFADTHAIAYPAGATRYRIATNVRAWLYARDAKSGPGATVSADDTRTGGDATMAEFSAFTVLAAMEVAHERGKQVARWGEQHHPDGTGLPGAVAAADLARRACQKAAEVGTLTWRHILKEEVAEAMAETDPLALRGELVQVAAVACAWIEAIDRRVGAKPNDRMLALLSPESHSFGDEATR